MRRIILAILLTATFTGPTSAVVSWEHPGGVGVTCLRRVYGADWPAGICRHNLEAGAQSIALPGELAHMAYVPAAGDVYILEFDGVDVGQATLGERAVYSLYLPLVTRQAGMGYAVRLPVVMV